MAGLQAVHSGADLQSAAAAVMGYEQVTMKGKAIKVSPVPGVATARLQSLLDQVLPTTEAVPHGPGAIAASAGANAASAGAQPLDDVKRLLEVRLELLPALATGNVGCADRFRYKLGSFCTLCEHPGDDVSSRHATIASWSGIERL